MTLRLHQITSFWFCLLETKAVCKYLDQGSAASDRQLLHGVSQAARVYYNYTGSASCLNTSQTATSSLGFLGWYYQVGRTWSARLSAESPAGGFSRHRDVLSDPSSPRPAPRW